ncbi:MAG: hypothetical protein HDT39_14625 [Lachnospiraceae bacterium]|nr:hypothetical protein [Lachnospiraceae bacterium]
MSEKIIPDSIDNALSNVTGRITETAGALLDAALTYAGRNVIKRYKFSKADDALNKLRKEILSLQIESQMRIE